ncbi:RHS repeat-associated core domain-containing protein, partial [Romboutsia sp.]|uniref:RHS repeat-associated core domain-containing protein n=1 Tax=Romboutsia sp. TaxID=1965302 RepID=UPI002B59CAAC
KCLTDALGNKDTYEYDRLGNVIKRSFIDYKGALLTQTEHDYDEIGRLRESKELWFNIGEEVNATYVKTHFYFDEDNNLIRLVKDVDNLEQITDFEYDALGRQIKLVDNLGNETINEYDANNNLIKIIEIEKKSEGTDQEVFVTLNEYDELNRLIRTTDNLGNITKHGYNSQNKLEKREDPLGNIVSYVYDIFGRKILENRKIGYGEEIKTRYHYDNKGLLTKIEDDKGNPTLFKYDSLDRQVETEYADGYVEKRGYDKNNNIIQETDCNYLIKKYTYDELDRLKQVNIDKSNLATGIDILGSVYENYYYDGLGRMVKYTNQNSIVEFEFDSLGNLIKDVQNKRVVKSEYNSLGFRDKFIYPSGRKLNIISDGLNRIKRIENIDLESDYPGELSGSTNVLNNSFIGTYRLYERQFGNGVKSTFSYDGNKRNISVNYSKDEKFLFEIQSLYDDSGNKRFENIIKNLNNNGEFYIYDSLYRLIEARKGVTIPRFSINDFKPVGSIAGISSYNASDQMKINNFINLIGLGDKNKTEFSYDSIGNRVNKKETGKPDITYKTNTVNEYTNIDHINPIYDKNGNLISDGTFKYYYDYKNRLVMVRDIYDNVIARYTYDAIGRRIEKITNEEKVTYIYDGNNVVEERDDDEKIVAQYVFADDTDDIIQMVRKNNKDCYYLKNSLGNIIALSGNSEDIIEEYIYSPFGIVNSPSKVENPYLFTSRRLDQETMLMYYRARHYSPELGRFIQRDPKGYENSMNLFEYVGNNPINRIDPMGLQEENQGPHIDFGKNPGEGFVYDPNSGQWGDPVDLSQLAPATFTLEKFNSIEKLLANYISLQNSESGIKETSSVTKITGKKEIGTQSNTFWKERKSTWIHPIKGGYTGYL